jgi:hypothetical protein
MPVVDEDVDRPKRRSRARMTAAGAFGPLMSPHTAAAAPTQGFDGCRRARLAIAHDIGAGLGKGASPLPAPPWRP